MPKEEIWNRNFKSQLFGETRLVKTSGSLAQKQILPRQCKWAQLTPLQHSTWYSPRISLRTGPLCYLCLPLFDLAQLTNFADDNFCIESNPNLELLITDIELKLEMITKWLRDSGFVVNEAKTELCLFHKNDKPCIEIRVGTQIVKSKKFINVLGVTFDSKLIWSTQVLNCISKAKKSLYALRLLKRYFSPQHMRTLLDSYFYSALYYNAKVWLTPGLSANSKQLLLSASANALRSCVLCNSNEISFSNVHKINKKWFGTNIL